MAKPLTFDSIEPEKPRRVEFSSRPQDNWQPDVEASTAPGAHRRRRVVVKVAEPGYVPDGFEVAVRIDDTMFTALAGAAALDAASNDIKVVSVAHARHVTPPDRATPPSLDRSSPTSGI